MGWLLRVLLPSWQKSLPFAFNAAPLNRNCGFVTAIRDAVRPLKAGAIHWQST
jgi:hypothetical protein